MNARQPMRAGAAGISWLAHRQVPPCSTTFFLFVVSMVPGIGSTMMSGVRLVCLVLPLEGG